MYEILIASLMGLVYLVSSLFYRHVERFHYELLSFGSGTLLAIIFLFIMPEMLSGYYMNNLSLALVLFGFTFYHLIEKFIYSKKSRKREKELQEIHIGGFVIDNIIIGIFIYVLFHSSQNMPYFVLLPFFVHVISASIVLNHLGEKASLDIWYYVGLCMILPLSTVVSSYFYFVEAELYLLLPFLTGLLIYFVARDAIPSARKEKAAYFTLGVIIVFLLMLSMN